MMLEVRVSGDIVVVASRGEYKLVINGKIIKEVNENVKFIWDLIVHSWCFVWFVD